MHVRPGVPWRRRSRSRPVLIITAAIAALLAAGITAGLNFTGRRAAGAGVNVSAHGSAARHRPGQPVGVTLNQAPGEGSLDCTLQVPPDPLSAPGLATPYILGGGCRMSDPEMQAFAEADILNPRTGNVKAYDPLVITQGTAPAARPVPPRVPPGDVVAIMFGFNGRNLELTGTGRSLHQGRCVNGLGRSLFSQVAYCNSPAFYRAANRDISRRRVKLPALGTGSDGQPCPTVRSFAVVDQDQSDNVVTTYLLTRSGQTAQDSDANAAALRGATVISNGSDNALVNRYLDPALGCTPYRVHDKTAPGRQSGSQVTDELLAAASQAPPVALVPLNDPMTLADGKQGVAKTNLYRAGVDQPAVSRTQTADTPASYCRNMMQAGMARIARDRVQLSRFASPVPGTASTLFTFLAARLSASFRNLGCGTLLRSADPVRLTLDHNGVATAVQFGQLSRAAARRETRRRQAA